MRYSQQTIDCYLHTLRLFFSYHAEKSIATITLSDKDDFINQYIIKRKLSESYQSQFVGELLNLKISDINSNRMVINIRNGKGMKDRIVPLLELVLEMLRNYYKQYRPKEYLFEGQQGGKYSERSIELVLKKAVREAGIQKNINLHMLRHSYATHLMEMGTNLRYIQELLGHKSSRTTEIYTHVSRHTIQNITSPIDKLKLKI